MRTCDARQWNPARWGILAVVVAFLASGVVAPAAEHIGGPTFRAIGVDFPQVTVRVKLMASGPLEVGSSTFEMSENAIPIEGFFLASATPRFYLILLLDRSSSVEPVVGDIKRSAARFLYSLPSDTRISLMTFGSDCDICCDFTTDRPTLIHGIKTLRAWGGTALYDALFLACEQLYSHSDPRDLRTIVLFTDGRDETPALRTQMSIKNLDEVMKLAEQQNIRIITVGMGNEIDRGILQRLARETDGWESYAPTAKELSGIYQSISRQIQLERHFVLHYMTPSSDRDGVTRQIEVRVRLPTGTITGKAHYEAPGHRRTSLPAEEPDAGNPASDRPVAGSSPASGSGAPGQPDNPDTASSAQPAGLEIAPPDLAPATATVKPEPSPTPPKPKVPRILE